MSENLPAVQEPQKQAVAIINGVATPADIDGLYRLAKVMAMSGLMPKGVQTPEAVFVAMQIGLEVGLSPMQAVQNVAVINGRPSIWGDAVLAMVRASGLLVSFSESWEGESDKCKAICKAIRKNEPEPIIREFSVADAKSAGLWGKDGPWKQYPKRMLQMRARSWALRDGFGDILKGLRIVEEQQDVIDAKVSSNGVYQTNNDLEAAIKSAAPAPQPEPEPVAFDVIPE